MLPQFVEVGPRLYQVEVVPRPQVNGRTVRCHVDRTKQLIRINASVELGDRPSLLADAVSAALHRPRRCQLVPIAELTM
jgi:hypothetical protein